MRALGLLEVARTLFVLGRLDGQAPYYEGAALDDSAGSMPTGATFPISPIPASSRNSTRPTAPTAPSGCSDSGPSGTQPTSGSAGERLREHYRRLYFARKTYRLITANRHYFITETFRSGSRDFDDRGLIYIRQGPPDAIATWTAPGLQPNVSWRYDRPDGNLVLHFVANEDVQDYKLVESVYDILGYETSLALLRGDSLFRAFETADQLVVSRDRLDPIYHKLEVAGVGSPAGFRIAKDEREMGRLSIAAGTYHRQLCPHLPAAAGRARSGDRGRSRGRSPGPADRVRHQRQVAGAHRLEPRAPLPDPDSCGGARSPGRR